MTTEHVWTLVADVLGALWIFSKCPVDYTSLKHVSLGQFAAELRKMLFEWLGWSIGFIILHYVSIGLDLIVPSLDAASWKVLTSC